MAGAVIAADRAEAGVVDGRITLTIVTPSFNPGQPLVEACGSVARAVALLEERAAPVAVEQIVCDDGSTAPAAFALYDDLARRFPFVRILHNTGQANGPAAARNHALKCARGDWVGFLDADDHVVSDGLVSLIEAALQHPDCQWVAGDSAAFHPDGREVAKPSYCRRFCPERDPTPIVVDAATLLPLVAGPPNLFLGTMIAKKALIEKAGKFDAGLRRSEDWYLTLVMATMSGVVYVPVTVLRFRRGFGSLTESSGGDQADTLRATWRAMTERRFRAVRRVLRWTLITQAVQLRDVNLRQRRRARAFRFGMLCAALAPENPGYVISALRCLFARPAQDD